MRQINQHCVVCHKQMLWNLNNVCELCEQENSEENRTTNESRGQELNENEFEIVNGGAEESNVNSTVREETMNKGNSDVEEVAEERASELDHQVEGADENDEEVGQRESRRRMLAGNIKIRGGIEAQKKEGITRLFAVNCNGFGPDSQDKIRGLSLATTEKELDGVLISSADTRWNSYSKTCMKTKISAFASSSVFNTSDSREALDQGKTFLKGGSFTALWGDVRNYVKLEERHEHHHGWWNTMVLEGNKKRIAIITMHRLVDNDTKSINSSKAQYDRKVGKVTRAKVIREKC